MPSVPFRTNQQIKSSSKKKKEKPCSDSCGALKEDIKGDDPCLSHTAVSPNDLKHVGFFT